MPVNPTLTAERLREVLDYDPDTGVFRWKVSPSINRQIGDIAGGLNDKGYRKIRVDGVHHSAHRLAWLYAHGSWPVEDIDHRNGVPGDDRISNLREATQLQNSQNRSRPRSDTSSGFLGVHCHAGRWQARITAAGRRYSLGHFDTPIEASMAYLNAKRELHPFWVGATTNQGESLS